MAELLGPLTESQHNIESDTRHKFKELVALRLLDFSYETYEQLVPEKVEVEKFHQKELNGIYRRLRDGAEGSPTPIFVKEGAENLKLRRVGGRFQSGPGCRCRCLLGQRWECGCACGCGTPGPSETAVWEIADVNATSDCPKASVRSDAHSPTLIKARDAFWSENGAEDQMACENREACVYTKHTEPTVRRRVFEHHETLNNMPWLLVAESGSLQKEECVREEESGSDPVSIVLAFRGTNSMRNVLTDMDARRQSLADAEQSLKPQIKDAIDRLVAGRATDNAIDRVVSAPCRGSCERGDSLADPLNPQEASWQNGLTRTLACFLRNICDCLCCICSHFSCPGTDHNNPHLAYPALEQVNVHEGFFHQYEELRNDVRKMLKKCLEEKCQGKGKDVELYVTGHSLGGAIAEFFALDFASSPLPEAPEPTVYTFGSPRPGNNAFRSIYNSLVPSTFCIVAARDPISVQPMCCFTGVGREVWFDDTGEATFAMSWAMKNILPSRDDLNCHSTLFYYKLLGKFYRKKNKKRYKTTFEGVKEIEEALGQ